MPREGKNWAGRGSFAEIIAFADALAAAAIDVDEPQEHVGRPASAEPRSIRHWLAASKSLGITRSNVAAASGTQRVSL